MKKGKKALWIILAVILVLAVVLGCNRHLVWVLKCNLFPAKVQMNTAEWTGGQSYEKLPYSSGSESQYLDLYVPDSEEKLPLFVLVHGGGFVSGDSQTRQAQFMIRYFRDHGFACASVNYRLAQEAAFPAAVDDVRAAVHFLAENAGQYGYDMEKVAIWGESAGGYLAAREAISETDVKISAMVDYYGIMEFPQNVPMLHAEGIPQFVLNIANGWLNKDLEQGYHSFEEYWIRKLYSDWTDEDRNNASVVYQAGSCVNPDLKSLILHGDADITVAYDQSNLLKSALEKSCGAENVEMYLLHGYTHASDAFYSDEQLAQVEAFLRSALAIE